MFLEEGELMVSNKTKISIACLSFGIELGFFFMSNYLHLLCLHVKILIHAKVLNKHSPIKKA